MVDFEDMEQALERDVKAWLWRKAAKHDEGAGLEAGADFYKAKLEFDKLQQQANMLEQASC